jgi:hypothetical protein
LNSEELTVGGSSTVVLFPRVSSPSDFYPFCNYHSVVLLNCNFAMDDDAATEQSVFAKVN